MYIVILWSHAATARNMLQPEQAHISVSVSFEMSLSLVSLEVSVQWKTIFDIKAKFAEKIMTVLIIEHGEMIFFNIPNQ